MSGSFHLVGSGPFICLVWLFVPNEMCNHHCHHCDVTAIAEVFLRQWHQIFFHLFKGQNGAAKRAPMTLMLCGCHCCKLSNEGFQHGDVKPMPNPQMGQRPIQGRLLVAPQTSCGDQVVNLRACQQWFKLPGHKPHGDLAKCSSIHLRLEEIRQVLWAEAPGHSDFHVTELRPQCQLGDEGTPVTNSVVAGRRVANATQFRKQHPCEESDQVCGIFDSTLMMRLQVVLQEGSRDEMCLAQLTSQGQG